MKGVRAKPALSEGKTLGVRAKPDIVHSLLGLNTG